MNITHPTTTIGPTRKVMLSARASVSVLGQRKVGPTGKTRNLLFCSTVVAVLLMAALLAVSAPDSIPVEYLLIASAIFVVGCLPACLYVRNTRSAPIPILALIGAYYVCAYSLPAFVDPATRRLHWFDTIASAALIGALIALCSQSAGFLFGSKCLRRSTRPFRLPVASSETTHKIALWLLVALECTTILVPAINTISTIKQFALYAGLGSYGALFVMWRKRRLTKIEVAALCLFVMPLEFVTRLATGLLAQLVMPFLFICLVAWATERAVYWKTGLVVVFGVALLNGVKAEYRQNWVNGTSANTLQESLQGAKLMADIAYTRSTNRGGSAWDSHFLERMSQIGFLNHVMNQTPAPIPYLLGSSYAMLIVKPIPRLFWPDKPLEDAGYWFSERYGMRSTGDYTTSFNVPWAVEAYANFGYLGLTIAMFIIGCIVGLLDNFFNSVRMTGTDLAFGIAFMYSLAFQESNFSLVIGNIVPCAIALYLYFSLWTGSRTLRSRRTVQAVVSRSQAMEGTARGH